jgi:tRNA(fMet)-specific endonuclease VapC
MEDMDAICIDTDIVIDYLRGKEYRDVLPHALDKYLCRVTPITAYELYYGGFYSKKLEPVEDVLALLDPMKWTEECSKEAARIHVDLMRAGFPLEIRDILIAGICCNEEIPLLTRNIKHFQRIEHLQLVDIPETR